MRKGTKGTTLHSFVIVEARLGFTSQQPKTAET